MCIRVFELLPEYYVAGLFITISLFSYVTLYMQDGSHILKWRKANSIYHVVFSKQHIILIMKIPCRCCVENWSQFKITTKLEFLYSSIWWATPLVMAATNWLVQQCLSSCCELLASWSTVCKGSVFLQFCDWQNPIKHASNIYPNVFR